MNLVKLLANNWQPIAIIALIGTGLAVSHHQGYKSAFAKQQAVIEKMERDKAQAEWGRLILEQSTWTAHSRIESLATEQLKMRIPDATEIRMVSP